MASDVIVPQMVSGGCAMFPAFNWEIEYDDMVRRVNADVGL
jgi:hypothetical protein